MPIISMIRSLFMALVNKIGDMAEWGVKESFFKKNEIGKIKYA